jgi:hypothetical protein
MKIQKHYLPFILMAVLALLAGLWAGLMRIGWRLPAFPGLALAHGPLMVGGFLGVLIPLERAVAIRQKWMFAAPAVTSLGWIWLLLAPGRLPAAVLTLGSLLTLGILGVMVQREPKAHTLTMALGTLAWVLGNALWTLGMPVYRIVYLWAAYLVLTIAGERLELNRITQPSAASARRFNLLVGLSLLGALSAAAWPDFGVPLTGVGFAGLAVWFLPNDIATRNLRHPSALTRFIATCLYSGFLWLLLAGGMLTAYGAQAAGPLYDAALHMVFVGFVMSMIFGHAPIIFPAILGLRTTFASHLYLPLGLLHLSLALRVIGDLRLVSGLRAWGGLLNEAAILLFFFLFAISVRKGGQA